MDFDEADIRKIVDNIAKWQDGMSELCMKMMNTIESQAEKIDNLEKRLEVITDIARVNRWRIESLPFEMMDDDYKDMFFKPHILSVEETRRQIIENRKSISRFGDGEFAVIQGVDRWNFQNASVGLAEKLRMVLESNDLDMMIGLNPNFYSNLIGLSEGDADGVRSYMRPEVRRFHCSLLDRNRIYGNALLYRIEDGKDVNELKKMWEKQDCIFVEGIYTRMGVGNNLFDNCANIERILCPARNAFDKYDDILSEVMKQPKSKLILIALGPTATALAYDLYKEGYWVIDIGHIDLVYEKYIAGASSLLEVKIPYKYCTRDEIGEPRHIEEIDNETYQEQIIARI